MHESVDAGVPEQPAVHPDQDPIAAEVASWFTASSPEIGREVKEFWYGYCCNLSPTTTRVILRLDQPDQLPSALHAARAASGPRTVTIWVENRDRAARLDAALRDCGCRPGPATTHLALVGPNLGSAGPDDLVIQNVGETGIEDWVTVKLQAFDNTEVPPEPDRLAHEVAARRSELPIAQLQTAQLDGENVAVLAYYRGRDQMVFNLATRLPYRHRGIAQTMLRRWVEAGTTNGCRSLMINATDDGCPAQLYRRLGFTDEVYWYQTYDLGDEESEHDIGSDGQFQELRNGTV